MQSRRRTIFVSVVVVAYAVGQVTASPARFTLQLSSHGNYLAAAIGRDDADRTPITNGAYRIDIHMPLSGGRVIDAIASIIAPALSGLIR
jgi:hypothetical protein